MKKLAVILMLAVGLILGYNTEEPKGQKTPTSSSKVVFEPVCRKPAPKDNYRTDDTDWILSGKEKNCYSCNLKHMVGMTFMAYPSEHKPFQDRTNGNAFGVVSPEKFTIEAVESGSMDWMKIKFESGKIGYIDVFSYFYSTEPFPEFAECIGICRKACE